jgi:nucleotide-binding universal stress UspA family protein
MKMSTLWFQRILVPLDGSTAAKEAIPVAERIANAYGGKIELLEVSNISSNPTGPQDVFAINSKRESEREEADREMSALQRDSISVEREKRSPGTTEEDIVETAVKTSADLIVLCSQKYTENPEDTLLNDVAQQVERDSPQPVLLLHRDNPTPKQPLRALVTLDPNDRSSLVDTFLVPAMQLVAALNMSAQGTLHLFGVVSKGQALDEARIRLKGLADDLHSGAKVLPTLQITSEVVTSGNVAEAITDRSKDFNLIAMATHGRGGLQHIFHHSVTKHVLGRTKLPLFIVHHPYET